MPDTKSFWEVIGVIIYLLPVILIVWKGGAMANQIKTMHKDIEQNKKDINSVGQKVDHQKDVLATALQEVVKSVNSLTNEVTKLATKMDSFDERLDKLESRVDQTTA